MYAYKDPPSQYLGLQLKDRQSLNHASEWYSIPMYLSYCLYPPLYLTGPTITFNDFVCQLRQPRHPAVCTLPLYLHTAAACDLYYSMLEYMLCMYGFTIAPYEPLNGSFERNARWIMF